MSDIGIVRALATAASLRPQTLECGQRFRRLDQRFRRLDQRFRRLDQRFRRLDQRKNAVEWEQYCVSLNLCTQNALLFQHTGESGAMPARSTISSGWVAYRESCCAGSWRQLRFEESEYV
jgi:hypothetical protein